MDPAYGLPSRSRQRALHASRHRARFYYIVRVLSSIGAVLQPRSRTLSIQTVRSQAKLHRIDTCAGRRLEALAVGIRSVGCCRPHITCGSPARTTPYEALGQCDFGGVFRVGGPLFEPHSVGRSSPRFEQEHLICSTCTQLSAFSLSLVTEPRSNIAAVCLRPYPHRRSACKLPASVRFRRSDDLHAHVSLLY